MSKYTVIQIGDPSDSFSEVEVNSHIPHQNGNSATLCGLDGDDLDPAVAQKTIGTTHFVDCKECISIWKAARQVKPRDISYE